MRAVAHGRHKAQIYPVNRTWLAFLLPALALGALVAFLLRQFPDAVADARDRDGLIAALVWALLPLSALVLYVRRQPGVVLGAAAFWIAAGAVLVLAYSLRFEAEALGRRLLAELIPSLAMPAGAAEFVLRIDRNGHFALQAEVEGVAVRFLVDTGASDVVLTMRDARRVGLDISALRFNQPYRTANGVVMGAAVRLDSIAIGDILLEDVEASVNPAPMAQSLLGMSFLGRLSSYEFTRDTLTLRQ
jgi:aspartyl protease family protein